MNTRDAAAYLGLSIRTMERHRQQHTGPLYSRLGGVIRYERRDLDLWRQENKNI